MAAQATARRNNRQTPGPDHHYFQLTPEQLASVRAGRGRRPAPSEFQADVEEAMKEPGKYLGFKIERDKPASWIISQLRKACRHSGLEPGTYSIFTREKDGYVAFQVHPIP